MDSFPPTASSGWTLPDWLSPHLLPDARFARAYAGFADDRRALIKGLIARHYALAQPQSVRMRTLEERHELFIHRSTAQPVSFVLLLVDHDFDAPALLLAALMPALCARSEQVLVCRLGKKADVPDVLLVSCELAGQERVAALGPMLLQRLLAEAAASGAPGVAMYPQSGMFSKLFSQPALRDVLDASALRLVGLRPPRVCGLWRDEPGQFPPLDVSLLYGPLGFVIGGAAPVAGSPAPAQDEWFAFRAMRRELALVPAARAAETGAQVSVAENCLGQWCWPQITPELFLSQRQRFTAAT